jgi:hypothetical protein
MHLFSRAIGRYRHLRARFLHAIGRYRHLRARFLHAIALQAVEIKTATLAFDAYIMGKTTKEFGLTCRGLR